MGYISLLLKKIVVIKEKVHEDDTKAAKTPLAIYYAQWSECILHIPMWEIERQCSVKDFWSGKSSNSIVIWLLLYIVKIWADFLGNHASDYIADISWQWVSTQQ